MPYYYGHYYAAFYSEYYGELFAKKYRPVILRSELWPANKFYPPSSASVTSVDG